MIKTLQFQPGYLVKKNRSHRATKLVQADPDPDHTGSNRFPVSPGKSWQHRRPTFRQNKRHRRGRRCRDVVRSKRRLEGAFLVRRKRRWLERRRRKGRYDTHGERRRRWTLVSVQHHPCDRPASCNGYAWTFIITPTWFPFWEMAVTRLLIFLSQFPHRQCPSLFQITADEAIFTISMIVHERSHHRASASRGRVSDISEAGVRASLGRAVQRLLAHQNPDGGVSYYRAEKG